MTVVWYLITQRKPTVFVRGQKHENLDFGDIGRCSNPQRGAPALIAYVHMVFAQSILVYCILGDFCVTYVVELELEPIGCYRKSFGFFRHHVAARTEPYLTRVAILTSETEMTQIDLWWGYLVNPNRAVLGSSPSVDSRIVLSIQVHSPSKWRFLARYDSDISL